MLHLSLADRIITVIDQGLRVSFGGANAIDRTHQPTPGSECPAYELNPGDRALSASLMRINHAGEVAAQALYCGQALVAKNADTRAFLMQAAREEGDHLAWCAERLVELNARPSILTPLWFAASAGIGLLAGLGSDEISLGFIDETERQVEGHLADHLNRLPTDDLKSRRILEKMKSDEAKHASHARAKGAHDLKKPVQIAMRQVSKIMTFTAGRI
jgi:ubiquinone biosynthesis monooxygenase Coq7